MKILFLLFFSLFLFSCSTVPETGRSQMILISSSQEVALGAQSFGEIKQTTKVSNNKKLNAMLQKVGHRIAAVAPLPDAEWEFVLFEEGKTMNAFCLPGGKVGIYTGILKLTQNEAGLATVVGHEVAHAVARHGAERISQALAINIGSSVLGYTLNTSDPRTKNLILGAYNIGSNLGIVLPYSRQHELEADHLGLLYMARAGYDPREAIKFWQRFKAYNDKQGSNPPVFLSTHPLDETRIAALEEILPRAMMEYRQAQRNL